MCSNTLCTEMREGKHWREHIDYYGLAAVSYCLLFQNYIEVVQVKLLIVAALFDTKIIIRLMEDGK